jgi:asparagine synthase (glutamine-hydrolysing)
MVDILAHRGPDGRAIWSEGSVGLGHGMLHTTPESLNEHLPFERDGLAITADARIDNREELIGSLRLETHQRRRISDSELILHAYRKWKEECPARLIGDFAFAIWDSTEHLLFCARDPFGIRPLFYHHSDNLFVFASEIKALFRVPGVPRQLDELRIGYHLVPTVEDKAITFYRDIRRLVPGHSLVLTLSGVRYQAFWSLDSSREVHLPSDKDYAEAFREIFFEAVRCRLRSAFPIGSTLSGGLDSSAVTCVAREQLAQDGDPILQTFSAVFDQTPQCDERSYIDAVLSQGGLEPHYIQADRLNPFTDLEEVFGFTDEPFSSPTFYLFWGLCRAAREQGVRVLLDGLDGDTAVHHGDSYLAELARGGEWVKFASEARAIASHENLPSVPSLIRQYGLPYLTELAQAGRWDVFAREGAAFSGQFGFRRRDVWWHCGVQPVIVEPTRRLWRRWLGNEDGVDRVGNLIRPEFANRNGLADRIRGLRAKRSVSPRSAREEHHALLTSGLLPYAFELTDKASAAFGMESRHAFADRRLVEFCLALPPQQKLREGWIRLIVRRALSDVLPAKVAWRGGKTVNSPAVTAAFGAVKTALLDEIIMKEAGPLESYVNVTALRELYQRYLARNDLHDEILIWQAATLALWLRYTGLDGSSWEYSAESRQPIAIKEVKSHSLGWVQHDDQRQTKNSATCLEVRC